jgi:hypothetical protein
MNFKIITFASDETNPIFKLLKSKLPLTLLSCENFDWAGKNTTPVLLNFLNTLSEDDLVLLCDSYDVLPLNDCTVDKLYNSILNNFDLTKITFNAETQCFPDKDLEDKYPIAPNKWRYLNGGLMTGKVKNLKNLLEIIISKKFEINQKIYAELFLTTNLIDLDYECRVFQTLLAGPYPNYPEIDMNDFIIEEKVITNKYFKTKPLLFHGNGSVRLAPLLPFIKTISS